MKPNKKDEMWVATWMCDADGELSFGNLRSRIHPSAKSAWNACKRDFNATLKDYPEAFHFVNKDSNRIELWCNTRHIRVAWEIQRMRVPNSAKNAKKCHIV